MTPDRGEHVTPIESRRRRRVLALQKLQHVVPALGLMYGGARTLAAGAGGAELAVAIAEILTTALLVVTFVKDLRATAHGPHEPSIEWLDVWAAGVLFAEAAEKWQMHHHLARPTILTAVLTLGLGLMHRRLALRQSRRRALHVTADGILVRRGRFRTFKALWDDVASITIGERDANITTRGGKKHRIDLSDLENAPEIRAALVDAQERLAAGRREAAPTNTIATSASEGPR